MAFVVAGLVTDRLGQCASISGPFSSPQGHRPRGTLRRPGHGELEVDGVPDTVADAHRGIDTLEGDVGVAGDSIILRTVDSPTSERAGAAGAGTLAGLRSGQHDVLWPSTGPGLSAGVAPDDLHHPSARSQRATHVAQASTGLAKNIVPKREKTSRTSPSGNATSASARRETHVGQADAQRSAVASARKGVAAIDANTHP